MWRLGRDWIAGSVLVLVGLLLLAERRAPDLVPVIPLLSGLLLLALFLLRRSGTALLLGGILTGVGVGVLVDRGGGEALAAAGFLACLAGGFLVTWLGAVVFGISGLRLWPLLVATAFGALAVVVHVAGWGPDLQRITVRWWPAGIVVLGALFLAAARSGARRSRPDDDTRLVPLVGSPDGSRGGPPLGWQPGMPGPPLSGLGDRGVARRADDDGWDGDPRSWTDERRGVVDEGPWDPDRPAR